MSLAAASGGEIGKLPLQLLKVSNHLELLKRYCGKVAGGWKKGDLMPSKESNECARTSNGYDCDVEHCRFSHSEANPGKKLGRRIAGKAMRTLQNKEKTHSHGFS